MKERRALIGEQVRLRPAWVEALAQDYAKTAGIFPLGLAQIQTTRQVGVVVSYNSDDPEMILARFGGTTIIAGPDHYDIVRPVETWEIIPR